MPSGTLYVVATPIGNLEDITLRALRVLREADLIAAEDTRRTSRLLHHYGISTPATSFHEHNERAKMRGILERLTAGQSVALVSDAGTPLVSDPGQGLVAAAREAGITVTPIPGASAITTILAAAGIPVDRFCFHGFAPRGSNARKQWLREQVKDADLSIVVFEAPHRVEALLREAQDVLGDKPIVIGRELTKIHEQVVICPISQALSSLASSRGEFVLVFPPTYRDRLAPSTSPDADWAAEVGALTKNEGLSARAAASVVARRHGLKTNQVYRAFTLGGRVGRTPELP